jgi:hypothetical protein
MIILRDDYALARSRCKEAKVQPPLNRLSFARRRFNDG